MSYKPHSIQLSDGQLHTLAKAIKNRQSVTLRLDNNQLTGGNRMMLTQTQINKINKAKKENRGVDLDISKTQISHVVPNGGNLMGLISGLLPIATKIGSKVLPGLATGALSSLGSAVTNKILGRGRTQAFKGTIIKKIYGKGPRNRPYQRARGAQNRPPVRRARGMQNRPYFVPFGKLPNFNDVSYLLTNPQIKQIQKAYQERNGVNIKPTKTQQGGLIGSLLASIGVPILAKMLGSGSKKKTSGRGLFLGKNSPFRGIPIVGDIL